MIKTMKNFIFLLFSMVFMIVACRGDFHKPLTSDNIANGEKEVAFSNDDSGKLNNIVSTKNNSNNYHVKKDISYGNDPLQKFDVYYPLNVHLAPVILMVHGGAWRFGDKSNSSVYKNKVDHWVANGFIFISVNYRMLPDADVLTQANDVALALAKAQTLARAWGGDPDKFILMGHSAGAHLIALISSAPSIATSVGAEQWLGSVLLDSAAFDVVKIMEAPHYRLYDMPFGADKNYWIKCSPLYQLKTLTSPILAVCSARREDSVSQSKIYVEKALSFGSKASVLPVDMSHGEINGELGLNNEYTKSVDAFIESLILNKKSKL
jgi:acetyl esterase/lipase